MKKLASMFLILAMVCSLFAFHASAATDDYGNTYATAYNWNLTANTVNTLNGTLEVVNDVDMFKFVAPITAKYQIYSSNITVDVKTWLYNSAYSELKYDDDSRGNLNFEITYTLNAGQTYYLKVSHYAQNGVGTYSVNIITPVIYTTIKRGTYTSPGQVNPGTILADAGYTVQDLKDNFVLAKINGYSPTTIYNPDSTTASSTEVLKTGMYFSVPSQLLIPYRIAIKGDVDGNGRVNESDTSALSSMIASGTSYNPDNSAIVAADMDESRSLTSADLTLLRERTNKLCTLYLKDTNMNTYQYAPEGTNGNQLKTYLEDNFYPDEFPLPGLTNFALYDIDEITWLSDSSLLKTQMIDLHGSSYSRIIIMGDVTRDGMISVSDVVMMSSIISNPSAYTIYQRAAADVNFDGIFDAADTKLIRERIMNVRW